MPFVRAGNQRVHYLERGQGEPVLLLHGNWATSSWWEPVLERLPPGYRGIAYDLRGRGRSEGPDHGYSIPELAADLFELADALQLTRFHLVGHSLGSAVAMQAALEQPHRLHSLVVVAPVWVDGMPPAYDVPAAQEALAADRERFARALKALAPRAQEDRFWQRLVEEGHRQRLVAALRNLAALRAWRPGDALRQGGVPALVVTGEHDSLTGGANGVRAAAALRAAHLLIQEVGHSPNIEAPDILTRLLVNHFEQHQGQE